MTIPFPKPVTREMARANAVHFAEDKDGGLQSRDRAKIWAAIAALFPETEGTGDDVLDQDEFASWTRHQIDKLSNILAETMTRIDRLEKPVLSAQGVSANFEFEGWEGNLIQNEATNTEPMSDEDKEDLRPTLEHSVATLITPTLEHSVATLITGTLARMDLSVAEQETIRALRNHEAVVTPVLKSQRIAKGYGWISGSMQTETSPMDRADQRVRAHMGRNHFSQETIDRVVEALRDEPTPE